MDSGKTIESAQLIAKANGISPNLFRSRIRAGWSLDRAANQPIEGRSNLLKVHTTSRLRAIAQEHGIPYKTLYARLSLGWEPMRAATVSTTSKPRCRGRNVRHIPKELVSTAKQNGIAYYTLYHRLKKGWTVERATTQPPRRVTPSESKDRRIPSYLVSTAKQNGIDYRNLRYRLSKDWIPDLAASLPLTKGKISVARYHEVRGEVYCQPQKRKEKAKSTRTPKPMRRSAKTRRTYTHQQHINKQYSLQELQAVYESLPLSQQNFCRGLWQDYGRNIALNYLAVIEIGRRSSRSSRSPGVQERGKGRGMGETRGRGEVDILNFCNS